MSVIKAHRITVLHTHTPSHTHTHTYMCVSYIYEIYQMYVYIGNI